MFSFLIQHGRLIFLHSPLSKCMRMVLELVYRCYLPPSVVSQRDHIVDPSFSYHDPIASPCSNVTITSLPPWMTSLLCVDHAWPLIFPMTSIVSLILVDGFSSSPPHFLLAIPRFHLWFINSLIVVEAFVFASTFLFLLLFSIFRTTCSSTLSSSFRSTFA